MKQRRLFSQPQNKERSRRTGPSAAGSRERERETPPATAVSRIEDKGARSQGRLPELKQQRWDSSDKDAVV